SRGDVLTSRAESTCPDRAVIASPYPPYFGQGKASANAPCRPEGTPGGRISLGEHHNTLGDIRPEWWDARGSCLITQKTVVTRLHEAFLPAPHTGLRLAGPAHNLIGADTVCAQQDDLGPPDMLMRCVAIPYD